jgi:alkylation response protein AidB-like acyl-CoA dehydrogenase
MVERTGIGGGGGSFSAAAPGSVAGHLDRTAGSFVGHRASLDVGSVGRGTFALLRQLAEERGASADPVVRQDLARLFSHLEIVRMTGLRAKGGGARTGGEGNLAKLRMTELVRQARHLVGELLGPAAGLWGGDAPTGGLLQELIVFSPAPSIYGGTDEVQRNIIGERVLGLPKEPGNERDIPFRELLVGTQR